MIPRKTSWTIGLFVIIAIVMPHGIRPAQLVSTLTLIRAPKVSAPVLKRTPVQVPRAVPDLDVPPGSLDAFYASLRRGKVTRILHYGDSPTTADSITSDVRRLLQARFGDAGHGFLLIAKPWAWYGHAGMELAASGWKIEPASQARAPDGIHGLGGVSFRGGPGATSLVTLSDDRHTSAVVYYLAQPEGGDFSVRAGEKELISIHTAAEQKQLAFADFPLPAGTRSLRLTVTSGNVRLFGYRFDKDQPGIQYS